MSVLCCDQQNEGEKCRCENNYVVRKLQLLKEYFPKGTELLSRKAWTVSEIDFFTYIHCDYIFHFELVCDNPYIFN